MSSPEPSARTQESRDFWERRYAAAVAAASPLWSAGPNAWVETQAAGLTPIEVDGANRWWRLFDTPALLGGPRLRAWCERRILSDGRRYHDANLFCMATKP